MRRTAGQGKAILLGALIAAGCGPDTAEPVAGEEYRDMEADQIMFDVEHYLTSDGIRRGLLVADTVYLYEDSAAAAVRQVHVTLFDGQGRETGDLTADRGRIDMRTDAMVARGNVVLVTREGARRIETEILHFDPNGDRIWSDVPTTLREEGTVVRGSGFTSDAALENITVQDPSGTFEDVEVQVP